MNAKAEGQAHPEEPPHQTRRGLGRKGARHRPDLPREPIPDGALPELSRLVVQHFGPDLELALRTTYQKVVGRPLPPRFILTLEKPPQQTSAATDRPRPRRNRIRSAQPLKPEGTRAKPQPAGEGR